MPVFIPAILETSVAGVLRKIKIIQDFKLKVAHLDVMDGKAVPNTCWGNAQMAEYLESDLEVHLMVKDPLKAAEKWLGFNNVVRAIVRGEEVSDWQSYSDLSREAGGRLGVAFDPTMLSRFRLSDISHLSFILVMGVQSGFSGQEFQPTTWDNIRAVKKLWPDILIGMDGGMNEEQIRRAKVSGIHSVNAASFFWDSQDKRKVIGLFRK